MDTVTVRDLRNHGGRILERVAGGERVVVTLDGRPIAELRPVIGPALSAGAVLRRWRGLPKLSVARLRADIDRRIDPSL